MLNQTVWSLLITILVLVVIGAIFITAWKILSEKMIDKDPVKAALQRLEIVSVFCSIAILGLVVFRLPALNYAISPQEIQSAEMGTELKEDMQKMKELIVWGLTILMFWGWAGYRVMTELGGKMTRELEQQAPGTPSNNPLQRRP
jgi:heme/copper-type cytochrome/quinol oxidase subunit 2